MGTSLHADAPPQRRSSAERFPIEHATAPSIPRSQREAGKRGNGRQNQNVFLIRPAAVFV
jgi:hypothetical protein